MLAFTRPRSRSGVRAWRRLSALTPNSAIPNASSASPAVSHSRAAARGGAARARQAPPAAFTSCAAASVRRGPRRPAALVDRAAPSRPATPAAAKTRPSVAGQRPSCLVT
jgi:hypothetical protein